MVVMGFRHYKNLVLHKAWADFRAEAERTYLGVARWVLDPLINLAVYYLVFGVIFSQGGPDFVPFLLVGLVTWRFFEATVVRASSSILGNVAMIRQMAFPKVIFPLISVATCLLEYAFSLALLQSRGFSQTTPIVYVSNEFHCYRAGRYAARAGFTNVSALAAATPLRSVLPCYMREALALLYYWVFKTSSSGPMHAMVGLLDLNKKFFYK